MYQKNKIYFSLFYFSTRQMRQWDIQQQVFKTSRLIKHQEYGTYESNRGNISGRPSPSNSTPMTLHQLPKTGSKETFFLFVFKYFFSSYSIEC
jgi:hypothetical protein